MTHPFRHLRTILRHRHAVIRHCRKAGILRQGLLHDLSKFSPSEFWTGARYYLGDRSPNEAERAERGYSLAWMHHKGRNKHHYEYWVDINPKSRVYEPVPMPIRYVAEMFCDRVAASKIYRGKEYTDDHPLAYFDRGNAAKTMHPDTAATLRAWLVRLAENGEEAAFAEVRAAVQAARRAENAREPFL